MKAQVERLNTMSETLESSGFSREQSNAVIESVALAMETFAVTPEILDDRINKVMEVIEAHGKDIKDLKKDMLGLKKDILGLKDGMLGLKDGMLDHQRSMFRVMMAFMIVLLASVMGMFAALVTRFPSP